MSRTLFHITARSEGQEFFPISQDQVWKIMIHRLTLLQCEHYIGIHAFLLMGNHFHFLGHDPALNLDKFIQSFLNSTAHEVKIRWESSGQRDLISSRSHYYQVYRYIMQNPIRAGIVDKVEKYQFSTLTREVPFPIHSSIPFAFGGHEGELRWLNEELERGCHQKQILQKIPNTSSNFFYAHS